MPSPISSPSTLPSRPISRVWTGWTSSGVVPSVSSSRRKVISRDQCLSRIWPSTPRMTSS